ncbi:MAG TPA: MarR family transcriptional regulator [Candidatus Baltobacteraceae bacterium]|nr:MarR family transcriptional regulator [Candidatus Baltobacteraceae bacterium]
MSAERDVVKTLGNTVRTIRARVDRALQQSGSRLGQYQVLRHLWEIDGLTPREIADRLDVEMPTITRTVQRMVRDGLVARQAHPQDARSVRIYLTDRGRSLQPVLSAIIDRETEHALRGFSPHDRATLVRILEGISENCKD